MGRAGPAKVTRGEVEDNAVHSADTSDAVAAPAEQELGLLDAWWRAANYLSVGQIYLQENPLLREPRISRTA